MNVYRYSERLTSNPKKVILQFFEMSEERTRKIVKRVAGLESSKVKLLLDELLRNFSSRHKNFLTKLLSHFSKVEKYLEGKELSDDHKLLMGAYFSKEYSVEAAALFNPSITSHPEQSNLHDGELRVVISLRATGEGHLSSIEFRSGIIGKDNSIKLEETSNLTELPIRNEQKLFTKKELLGNKNYFPGSIDEIISSLPESFTREDFNKSIKSNSDSLNKSGVSSELIDSLSDYINSNYEVSFPEDSELSERIIFPSSQSESVGMEDLRLVKFSEGNDYTNYYGFYTAYNGHKFRVQMLETDDFKTFKVKTLHGNAIKDKGMALFPRKINGFYYMISRQGGENLYIMKSEDLRFWDNYELLKEPEEPWEFVQLGNCGSPIETDKGWLLITHAVGYFRKYVISACLLDLNDPSKVIASLKNPIIIPQENEREGYVPNVVYSCGEILHNNSIIIPYAMSDSASGFARVDLHELLSQLLNEN